MAENDFAARLTFNALAGRMFFRSAHRGVDIQIERGKVLFHPSNRINPFPLEHRSRGGITVDLLRKNSNADAIVSRLRRAGLTTEQPFFLVLPLEDGWFRLEHYPEEFAPNEPAMRVWKFEEQEEEKAPPPRKAPRKVMRQVAKPPQPESDMQLWRQLRRRVRNKSLSNDEWGQFQDEIRSARKAVDERPVTRGRVPRRIEQARAILADFERLLPDLESWAKTRPAKDQLGALVQQALPQDVEPSHNEPPQRPVPERRPRQEPAFTWNPALQVPTAAASPLRNEASRKRARVVTPDEVTRAIASVPSGRLASPPRTRRHQRAPIEQNQWQSPEQDQQISEPAEQEQQIQVQLPASEPTVEDVIPAPPPEAKEETIAEPTSEPASPSAKESEEPAQEEPAEPTSEAEQRPEPAEPEPEQQRPEPEPEASEQAETEAEAESLPEENVDAEQEKTS